MENFSFVRMKQKKKKSQYGKRKSVSLKINKRIAKDSLSSSSVSSSNVSNSLLRRNNKSLAINLNESKIEKARLEESVKNLKDSNIELRLEIADLKNEISNLTKNGETQITDAMEPLNGILQSALDHALELSGNLAQAMKLAAVAGSRSSASHLPRSSNSFGKSIKKSMNKVAPMIGGHTINRPKIYLQRLELSDYSDHSINQSEDSTNLTMSRDEVSDEVRDLETRNSRHQSRVVDLSLIGEEAEVNEETSLEEEEEEEDENEELRKRRVSSRRSSLAYSSESTLLLVPRLVLEKVRLSPYNNNNNRKTSKGSQNTKKSRSSVVGSDVLQEDTPRPYEEDGDSFLLQFNNMNPREGPSWLFEDIPNLRQNSKGRRSLSARQKRSSCSRKLSYVPQEEESSYSNEPNNKEVKNEVRRKSVKCEPDSSSALSEKQQQSNRRSGVKKRKLTSSEEDESKSEDFNSRPRRAATQTALLSLKEPSLNCKMRNNSEFKKKKSK